MNRGLFLKTAGIIEIAIAVSTVGNKDFLVLGDIANTLRFIKTFNAVNRMSTSQINDFYCIIPQCSYIYNLITKIYIHVINSPLHFLQRNCFYELELISTIRLLS